MIRTFGIQQGDVIDFELTPLDELKFKGHYQSDLHLSKADFDALLIEDSTETNEDKKPSSHVPDVEATVNISNTAFPILIARNDNNYWLSFGEKKAWDPNTLAYVTEAPSAVTPENMGANTATFNLPFVSIGNLGKGKLMMMGNARYNSVLVCPNGFSW
ncbi:DUF4092 domain-containing protein [Endozoicomonas acroporae]|uniref:DUF4092 domain-containing protein n=1 Tax=Endozoicomonas acroporae TaxID=1701104 RepID=UPI003D7B26F4